jgi:hypothetical protein
MDSHRALAGSALADFSTGVCDVASLTFTDLHDVG